MPDCVHPDRLSKVHNFPSGAGRNHSSCTCRHGGSRGDSFDPLANKAVSIASWSFEQVTLCSCAIPFFLLLSNCVEFEGISDALVKNSFRSPMGYLRI